MALTYTAHWETQNGTGAPASTTSTSRSYTSGDLIIVLYAHEDNASFPPISIANSGTAQTWTSIAETNTTSNAKVAAWRCVMSTTQSMTITVSSVTTAKASAICVIPHAGQHATTPVPAGNVFSGTSATDVSQTITPTSSGSALWMIAADYAATNTFAARADCTIEGTPHHDAGRYTSCVIRPTTQPRADASAFSIGETDTAGTIAWIAFEVQAAAGGGPTFVPRGLLLGVG